MQVEVVRAVPRDADAVAYPVGTTGAVPRGVGANRAALSALGFDGKPGQTLVLGRNDQPTVIAVGVGDPGQLTADVVRTAMACAVRAAGRHRHLATAVADLAGVGARMAGVAAAEGAILGGYRFERYKSTPKPDGVARLSLIVGAQRRSDVVAGVERGTILARAATLARDLANTPAADLPARAIADQATAIAAACGLEIEVFNRSQLIAMGCGGLVGVNNGSVEPPRLIKLSYRPSRPTGHLALVGKGVMFDSGGLSLKPSDGMIWMKLDMSGAAAVLAAMSVLGDLGCTAQVTGYMVCTDNMPSGTSMKLGDVLRFRNGKTAEIHNTDAEGRLALADGLCLAVEQQPDAIVDIATLTGAAVVALGNRIAAVLGTNADLVEQIRRGSAATGEQVWQMPLEPGYRKQLDSYIADFKNVGGPPGGVITASLFLKEFTGEVPWAHIDIAGPMNADADDGWLSRGATGFGARLLAEVASGFTRPR